MSLLRLVLLPYIRYFCGRCYCHMYWQMLLPIFMWKMLNHIFVWTVCNKCVGWCYCLWQMECPLQGDISLWQMFIAKGLILFQFEFWGVKQNLIPYVRQMEFAYINHLHKVLREKDGKGASHCWQGGSRAIKEALYIRVNNPSLNKNIGKFHLPHIWDEVLFNTSELKLK